MHNYILIHCCVGYFSICFKLPQKLCTMVAMYLHTALLEITGATFYVYQIMQLLLFLLLLLLLLLLFRKIPLFKFTRINASINIFGITTDYVVFLAASVLSIPYSGYFYSICLLYIIIDNDILQRALQSTTKNCKALELLIIA